MTIQRVDNLVPARPLSSLNFMFTEKCNLKCIYCPQCSEASPGADAPEELLAVIISYIKNNAVASAGIGFYGETLCFEGWERYAEELINAGVSLSICSNWNRKLSDDEVKILSRFSFIQFSIDTANYDLLRTLRPPADLRTILYNMHLIRSRVILDRRPHPVFMWCSVLSHKIIPYLTEFVALAISNGIQQISFNELEYYEKSTRTLKSIFDLSNEEFVCAADEIEKMDLLAKTYGVQITYAFNSFLDVVRKRKLQIIASSTGEENNSEDVCRVPVKGIQGYSSHLTLRSTSLAPSERKNQTRLCLQPWTTAYVLVDGTVCTCCVRGESMGKISADSSLDDVLNNNAYREFRWRLLTGNITDNACLACPVAPICSTEQLVYSVENLRN